MKYLVFLCFIIVLLVSVSFFLVQIRKISISVTSTDVPIGTTAVNDNSKQTTLLLGGDVMLGRSVTVEALDRQRDASFPFKNLTPLFETSDLIFVNLETPILNNCPRQTSGMVFCAPSDMLSGFIGNKTVVNLANNHTLNHGANGLVETIDILNSKNIDSTGNSNLLIKTVNGTRYGFVGFDYDQQLNPKLREVDKQLIQESKLKVDVLVVAMHWGVEYKAHPSEGQRLLAHELVNLGANVIVGHHPHWVEDTAKIENTPVFYSLGNLIFDQMWSEETRHGLLVRLTFEGKQIVKQELIPTYIEEIGQPIIMPSPNE